MVFIWSGRGYWGLVLPILFTWLTGMVLDNSLGPRVLEVNEWVYGLAVLAAAAVNWAYGRRWNGTTHLRPWDFTGTVRYRREHTIFSAPMELWSFALVIVGVWIIVANLPGVDF